MSQDYPAAGRVVRIDFGDDGPFGPFAAELTFSPDAKTVSFIVTRGALEGTAETLPCSVTHVTGDVWLVLWQEEDKLSVAQTQDFGNGALFSAVTTADQHFVQLDGTLELI